MPPRAFLDTNVLIYAFLVTDPRHRAAKLLMSSGGVMSVQVANEFVDVARRKMRWDWDDVAAMLKALRNLLGPPIPITDQTHQAALDIARRHGFRIYDSLIIAAAREAGCPVLYTEDLRDGQAVDGVLVRNPFLARPTPET
jgi:predicted nucleic acid-binding protein